MSGCAPVGAAGAEGPGRLASTLASAARTRAATESLSSLSRGLLSATAFESAFLPSVATLLSAAALSVFSAAVLLSAAFLVSALLLSALLVSGFLASALAGSGGCLPRRPFAAARDARAGCAAVDWAVDAAAPRPVVFGP